MMHEKYYNIINILNYMPVFTKMLCKAFCSKTANSLSQYIVQSG